MKKSTSDRETIEHPLLENEDASPPPNKPFDNMNILSRTLFFWVMPLLRVSPSFSTIYL